MLRVPRLTRLRMALALAVALLADGLQWLLNFFGWLGADQVIDVAAMVLTSWLIGFHWLLLPTFVVEFIPVADELPTWTACVVAVIALRRHGPSTPPKAPEAPGSVDSPPKADPPLLTAGEKQPGSLPAKDSPG